MEKLLLIPFLISFCFANTFASTQSLESLLNEKYKEAKLSESIKSNFDHNTLVDLKNIRQDKISDLKALYTTKTKEQENLLNKQERISGEIYLLEKLSERQLRSKKDKLSLDDWVQELLYLSKLPKPKSNSLQARYYLDLIVVLKSKSWTMEFPQILKHYLSYSPVNKPLDPFQFSYQIDYENKVDFEKVDVKTEKKNSQTEKVEKPKPKLENKFPSNAKDLAIDNAEEDFLLEELPSISFPEAENKTDQEKINVLEKAENNIELETEHGNRGMEIELIPNNEVSPLKAPKLKNIKKSKL
jgi:hypothetical protein